MLKKKMVISLAVAGGAGWVVPVSALLNGVHVLVHGVHGLQDAAPQLLELAHILRLGFACYLHVVAIGV